MPSHDFLFLALPVLFILIWYFVVKFIWKSSGMSDLARTYPISLQINFDQCEDAKVRAATIGSMRLKGRLLKLHCHENGLIVRLCFPFYLTFDGALVPWDKVKFLQTEEIRGSFVHELLLDQVKCKLLCDIEPILDFLREPQ